MENMGNYGPAGVIRKPARGWDSKGYRGWEDKEQQVDRVEPAQQTVKKVIDTLIFNISSSTTMNVFQYHSL